MRQARALAAALVLIATVLLIGAPSAWAATDAEAQLAARFAPQIRLVDEPPQCGEGEPYEPMDVEALFDEPTVALWGPWGGGDLVEVGPSAEAVTGGLYEYHLDFPGDALDPGCSFELWARRITEGLAPAVYAHVADDPEYPGQLALQYWIFYAYNDWNNLHEGDWEMIQLDFDAADAREALAREPVSIGYSQHEGAEGAPWGDERLEIVDGTHPVVYPAAGSHANFFGENLYLGSSAEQGVGCDDTRGPHKDLRPVVYTIPSDPTQAGTNFPWIEFEGRWGELQPAFFNGPTGPNLKTQWTEPIRWSEGWRDRGYTVPTGSAFGPRATDFFCSAIGAGSAALVRLVNHPLELGLVLAGIVALIVFGLSRATWRPAAPLRLARRRTWGQVLTAAARMYVPTPGYTSASGCLLLPISLVITGIQALLLTASSIFGVADQGAAAGFLVLIAITIGSMLTWLGLGLVQAVVVRAMIEMDAGRRLGLVAAFRLAAAHGRVLWSIVIFVVVTSLLTSSVILIPFAIWFAVRWSLVVPVGRDREPAAAGGLPAKRPARPRPLGQGGDADHRAGSDRRRAGTAAGNGADPGDQPAAGDPEHHRRRRLRADHAATSRWPRATSTSTCGCARSSRTGLSRRCCRRRSSSGTADLDRREVAASTAIWNHRPMGEVADDPLRQGRQALAAAEWAVARAQFERCLDERRGTDALAGLGEALQWLGEYDRAIELKAEAFDRLSARRRRRASGRGGPKPRPSARRRSTAIWRRRTDGCQPGARWTAEECIQHGWLAFDRAPFTDDPPSANGCRDRARDRQALRRRRPRVRRDRPARRRLRAAAVSAKA